MEGVLGQLIERRLGVKTTALVNRSVPGGTIGVAVVQLVRQDPNRVAWSVTNLSTANLFIGPFNTVSATRGIQVGPGGGFVFFFWEEDLAVTGWEWFAVATAAASPVLILEYHAVTPRVEVARAG